MEGGPDIDMEEQWRNEEVLKLLEGVDKFDDDWLLISEHVGTRTKEQCITKFLQLPINDEFLTAQLSAKELEDLPFGDLPNPVITTIAFLSGHINPGVGAAAAKTALKELLKSGAGRSEAMEVDNALQLKNEEEEPKVSLEDEMDIVTEEDDEKNELPGAFSKDLMKKATTSALRSAVENARKLASYEDQEIQHWTRLAVKTMVDKLSFKVQQYDELETSLETELTELEKQQNLLASSIEAIVTHDNSAEGEAKSTETSETATANTEAANVESNPPTN